MNKRIIAEAAVSDETLESLSISMMSRNVLECNDVENIVTLLLFIFVFEREIRHDESLKGVVGDLTTSQSLEEKKWFLIAEKSIYIVG